MSILQHLLQIRESATVSTIEVDWADDNGDTKTESGLKADLDHAKKEYGMPDCTFTIKTMKGPGGGWPVVRIKGPEDQLKKFLDVAYGDDDLDLYKVNESVVTEGFNNVSDLVDAFFDHIQVHSMEGRKGLTAFAKLCNALGYKDSNYYGQLDTNASIGDIVNFLEDNSGAIEAMIEFIKDHNNEEWSHSLADYLNDEGADFGGEDDDGDDDEDHVKESVQLDEKIFDEDKYTWYVWTNSKPSQPFERRGGSKQLTKGMQFGLRPATSKAGTWRLIMKQKGPSIIFSIDDATAKSVAKQALELI